MTNARIWTNAEDLKDHIDILRRNMGTRYGTPGRKNYNRVVMTSGGFDPLHVGHLECIQASAEIADAGILVVVVNGDGFLNNKKGYAFMDAESRCKIVSAIKGVDHVLLYEHPSDMTVCHPIEVIKPKFFTKGGDRDSSANVPEFEVCERIGTEVIFRVGGGKIQSSSELVGNAMKVEKNV